MSSRMYEHLMLPLCETYRIPCVAIDRRGFGKSEWNNGLSSGPFTFETFVADNVALLEHLRVGDLVFVGASMGAGESLLTWLASEFVRKICKGFVWIAPNMPYPLQSPNCLASPSQESVDFALQAIRDGLAQFVSDSLPTIFAVQAGNKVSSKTLDMFERIVDEADTVAFEKTAIILRRELVQELQEFASVRGEVPVLHLHGDLDMAMPLEASPAVIKKIVPWADLKVYKNAGHGLYLTHAKQALDDITCFVKGITKGTM